MSDRRHLLLARRAEVLARIEALQDKVDLRPDPATLAELRDLVASINKIDLIRVST
jgi:hypothetical protein